MPTRTCVGCQRTDEQEKMVRVVADAAGRIKIDGSRRQPGRGAYLHRDRECVAETVKRGSFGRAFRRKTVPLAAEELWTRISETKGKDT